MRELSPDVLTAEGSALDSLTSDECRVQYQKGVEVQRGYWGKEVTAQGEDAIELGSSIR
jgi:hypothetical protein